MKRFLLLGVTLLLAVGAWQAEAEPQTTATGIESIVVSVDNDAAKDNISGFLASFKGKAFNARILKEIRVEIGHALEALGYYHYTLEVKQQDTTLAVSAQLEPPLTWQAIDVKLLGAGQQLARLQQVVADLAIKAGQQVNHSKYQQSKSQFESELLELGFFDFQWQEAKLLIHKKNRFAAAKLIVDTGPRYQFGELDITGDTKAKSYIASLSPFQPGEPFKASLLADFNLALNETPYFSAIKVYPLLKQRHGAQIPIRVSVTDKPANSFEVGGGYSDDVGAKLRFKWFKPWITEDGHSFESNLRMSQKQQDITASYTIPVDDPNNDVWRVLGGYQLQDQVTEGIDSKIWNIQLQRQWLTADDWVRTAFIKREHETTQQGDDKQRTEMLIPGISYLKKESKGGALPYWGNERLLSVEVAADDFLSSADMLKVRWNNAWIRDLDERHLFFGRVDLGAIVTEDIEKIPFNHRFLAGGDQSIRGFAYESVGPRDQEGKIIGGKYLATASVEYNYQFHPNWRVALFSDVGTATNDFSDDWEVGAGFGFRYLTPVGPIRLDHAWGLTKESKSTRLSIVIGPEI